MRKHRHAFFGFFLMLPFALLSCLGEVDCLKSTGNPSTEIRKIKGFRTLTIKDNINVELTDHADSTVTISAGKHLIGKIKVENTGDNLLIANENTCNWARSYAPEIKVTVGVRQSNLVVEHYGYGTVTSTAPLAVQYLVFNSFSAGGNADIQLNNPYLSVYCNTQADLRFSGSTHYLQVIMDGLGRVSAEGLRADSCLVQHQGSNQVRVFPIHKLTATITRNGSILYYHQPDQLLSSISADGQLIRK